MPVRHPLADRDAAPAAATVGTTTYTIASDGTVECPADRVDDVADALAAAYDCDADALLEREEGDVETCDAELSSGGTCGRELPCQYHSDTDADSEA